jgi:hypothetical protein
MAENSIEADIEKLKKAKIGETVTIPLREFSHERTKQILDGMPDRLKGTQEWAKVKNYYM